MRIAVHDAMRSLTGQAVSDSRQERFLEKVWNLLKASPEKQGADSGGAMEVETVSRAPESRLDVKATCVKEQEDTESESAVCTIADTAVLSSMCPVADTVSVLPSVQRDNKENCPVSVAKASDKSEIGSTVASKIAMLRSARLERNRALEVEASAPPLKICVPGQIQGQGERKIRQPLGSLSVDRSLALSANASNVPNRNEKVAVNIHSPDKQDQRSVVEKRIGAMR